MEPWEIVVVQQSRTEDVRPQVNTCKFKITSMYRVKTYTFDDFLDPKNSESFYEQGTICVLIG